MCVCVCVCVYVHALERLNIELFVCMTVCMIASVCVHM